MMKLRLFKGRDEKGERVYVPMRGKEGLPVYVPPAVYRKYEQCKQAMLDGRPDAVKRIQFQLSESGYEVPTTASQCDDIVARMRKL